MGVYTCVHVKFRISKLTKQKASKDHRLHPSDYKREIQKATKKGDAEYEGKSAQRREASVALRGWFREPVAPRNAQLRSESPMHIRTGGETMIAASEWWAKKTPAHGRKDHSLIREARPRVTRCLYLLRLFWKLGGLFIYYAHHSTNMSLSMYCVLCCVF